MPSRRDLANAIRALSMDAVQQANSGHPGMPMGMADIAEVLWNDYLSHNPANPNWHNRDRFILSNGHGCMLHYSLLHLTGYDLGIEEIKNFRQLGSKTPGHPELGYAPGIETTTGPLGQGLANGVGMAIAEKVLASTFNRGEFNMVDHYTYVFAGDGCLMEGISHEACSLAGTLGLSKLIVFYDDNGISIDGKVDGWFSDDTPKRFEAYGWQVIADIDGHDHEAIKHAIDRARAETEKPSIICCKTEIGYGSPNLANSHQSHGAPLGADEIQATRDNIGWHHAAFVVPENIYKEWSAREEGKQVEAEWQEKFGLYEQAFPDLAKEFLRRMQGALPSSFAKFTQKYIDTVDEDKKAIATRKASGNTLNAFGPELPELFGGSADLTGSNCTWWDGCETLRRMDAKANYLHYGVREFGMFAIMNGMALHGGFIPYGGTFLTFVDYGRNAVRLAAMMQQKVIFVLSHDSIGLGEDGPTHQPIEHASVLRLTPGVNVWRPADAVETAVAWQQAVEFQGPSCLLLTRQNVPPLQHLNTVDVAHGGYILSEAEAEVEAIIIATGSEVELALQAQELLQQQGCSVRVVSMPSTTVFDQQDQAYKDRVLLPQVTMRVAIEAGQPDFWYKYVGLNGRVVGINRYGESAPYKAVYEALGVTADNVVNAVRAGLKTVVA